MKRAADRAGGVGQHRPAVLTSVPGTPSRREPARREPPARPGFPGSRGAAPALAAIAVALGLPAVASAGSVGRQQPDDRDWPQFRRDPALTGAAPEGPGASLDLRWTVPLGFSVEGSPAIAGGFVYATALPGLLVKLDLEDGAERWRYRPGASPDAPERQESAGTPADFEDDRFGESSPAVAGGLVFVGDLLGVFHAVDAETGTPRWTFATGAEIKASPVVIGDLVFIGSYDERFYALDRETGELRWSAATEGPVHGTPARQGDRVWITGCDAVLRGLRISDGAEVARFDSGAYTAASPALGGGALFYGTFDNEVLSVEADTGTLRWRYRHPERSFPFYASAALAGDLVVVAGRDKMVHALDRQTGEARWTFRAGARFDSSPAVAEGLVYAGNADGRLHVLDLETGEKRGEFHAGAPIMSSPALSGDRIVFGTQDGALFALGPAPAR